MSWKYTSLAIAICVALLTANVSAYSGVAGYGDGTANVFDALAGDNAGVGYAPGLGVPISAAYSGGVGPFETGPVVGPDYSGGGLIGGLVGANGGGLCSAASLCSRGISAALPAQVLSAPVLSGTVLQAPSLSAQGFSVPVENIGPISSPIGQLPPPLSGPSPLAIISKSKVDFIPVQSSAPPAPTNVVVDSHQAPVNMLVRSFSHGINLIHRHIPSKGSFRQTESKDEPHRHLHTVTKPVIQEIHEVITPLRLVKQEILPVRESIVTNIPRSVPAPYAAGPALPAGPLLEGGELAGAPYPGPGFGLDAGSLGVGDFGGGAYGGGAYGGGPIFGGPIGGGLIGGGLIGGGPAYGAPLSSLAPIDTLGQLSAQGPYFGSPLSIASVANGPLSVAPLAEQALPYGPGGISYLGVPPLPLKKGKPCLRGKPPCRKAPYPPTSPYRRK